MVVVDAWSACVVSPNGVRDLSVLFTQCVYIYGSGEVAGLLG